MNKEKAKRIYEKSIEVIKSVQLKNGGCLATPKGERYPYIYPRDHSIIALGFLSAGLSERAKRALAFIFSCQSESGAFPQRIDSEGRDASYKPVQIDGTGLVLYILSEYVSATNDLEFASQQWDRVKKAVNYIRGSLFRERGLVFTPNSIHEFPPSEQGLEIWANSVCWAALERSYNLGLLLHHEHPEWKQDAAMMKEAILKYCWNSRIRAFVKNIRVKESSSVLLNPDASKYAVADFGVLDDADKRVLSTVREIEKSLWHKKLGGICRYPKYEGRNNGGWGPWPHFTLILARHFIRTGNREKAEQYISWVLDISYEDMLPEHVATVEEFEEYVTDFTEAGLLRKDRLVMIENARKHPMYKKGLAYITIPLAWPHAEFIRTYKLYSERFHDGEL